MNKVKKWCKEEWMGINEPCELEKNRHSDTDKPRLHIWRKMKEKNLSRNIIFGKGHNDKGYTKKNKN